MDGTLTVGGVQGRVRTKTVKKAARVLVEKYYTRLTHDFQTNKKIAEDVAIIPSKRLRNKIAGFATVRAVRPICVATPLVWCLCTCRSCPSVSTARRLPPAAALAARTAAGHAIVQSDDLWTCWRNSI